MYTLIELQPDILPNLQEKIDRRVSVVALRCGAIQRDAVDILRVSQAGDHSSHHHQLSWLLHSVCLHLLLPLFRHQKCKGTYYLLNKLNQNR